MEDDESDVEQTDITLDNKNEKNEVNDSMENMILDLFILVNRVGKKDGILFVSSLMIDKVVSI